MSPRLAKSSHKCGSEGINDHLYRIQPRIDFNPMIRPIGTRNSTPGISPKVNVGQNGSFELLATARQLPSSKDPIGRTKAAEVTEKKTPPGQTYVAPPNLHTDASSSIKSSISTSVSSSGNDEDGSGDESRSRRNGTLARGKSEYSSMASIRALARCADMRRYDMQQIAHLEGQLEDTVEDENWPTRSEQEAFFIGELAESLDTPQYSEALEALCREIETEDQARKISFFQGPHEIVLNSLVSYTLLQQPKRAANGQAIRWDEVYRKWKSGRLDSTWERDLLSKGWWRNQGDGLYWRYRRGTSTGDQRYVFKVSVIGKVIGIWIPPKVANMEDGVVSVRATSSPKKFQDNDAAIERNVDQHPLFINPWL